MASNVTFLHMKKRALRLADMENTTFISQTADADGFVELDDIVNQAIRWTYNELVQAYGDDFYEASTDQASTQDQEDYSLPADFYKLIAIYYGEGASPDYWYPMRRFHPKTDMNRQRHNVRRYRYRIIGSNLRISPPPAANVTFRIHYVPTFTELSADGDTFDGINGFEDLAIVEAAIRMRMKEQNEHGDLLAERDRKLVEMRNAAANRDASEPEQIEDVEGVGVLDQVLEAID